jgi:hypothetical protein
MHPSNRKDTVSAGRLSRNWAGARLSLAAAPPKDRGSDQVPALSLFVVVCSLLASGFVCSAANQSATARNSSIYARGTNVFGSAVFFKPKETAPEDLVFRLAPLMMVEAQASGSNLQSLETKVQNAESTPKSPRSEAQGHEPRWWEFGALGWSNGTVRVDGARPAVYFDMDTVRINERAHARVTYIWCYAPAPGGPGGLGFQGIRLTLDLDGQPAIWEMLADSSGADLIFVSQSLEAAAARAFGKPLSGRHYSVERGSSEAPDVAVARVIDDGPVPMGPIVYLSKNPRDVSTLICRCMPAQAKDLAGTGIYDLLPLQSATNSFFLAQARAGTRQPTAFWPEEKTSDDWLEKCLRLPGTF